MRPLSKRSNGLSRVAALAITVAAAAVPAVAADDPVVATVDGEEIRASDVMRSESRLPAQLREAPPTVTLPMLITMSIDQRLLADEARRQGLDQTPEIKDQMRFMEELVLEQALLQKRLEKDLTPSAVKARYDELVRGTKDQEEIRARHILVEDEATAKDIIGELQKGADFETLAKERSVGPSKEAGGDLGYFLPGQMVPEFSDAASALKPGSFTETPIKTQFGWHVIKVEDRRKPKPAPFAEVEDRIRQEMAREFRAAYLEDLRKDAKIERFDKTADPAGAQ
ncbi:MAG: peptidylprolyl isomerase [Rhodospirillales bacterium]|nr:peptidylprolyl isomerase [Rhodospirillales bacterium]